MKNSFESRLEFLLYDRKQTPWGKSLGFPSATISGIFGGRIPGEKFLYAIRRAENVNLDWLLTGKGMPFYVELTNNGTSLFETVQQMLEDEPHWQVYVCSLGSRSILIFEQPGQYGLNNKWIDYRITEILVGPGSEELAAELRNFPNREQIKIPLLSPEDEEAIATGQVGTYRLFDSEDALLANHRPAKDSDLQFYSTETTSTAKPVDDETVKLDLMRAVVKLVEDCANELGENLNSDQKSRVITAVYRQADRLGLTAEDLTPDSIRTAIDVVRD
ncbi:helix-turn-helix domain containing protein [Photobacterium atrarenae]|uniref:Helix-turn-helix domain containing protein n=1 Tax=Photobacterium atrarenae TaxID=865757 RepID=A0ABY5GNF7_9GAMM|nr:helix-turn-helix domain containing protein [Photobacterium atrarenae]UTV30878.1 helix-turn-helix domain containing protein [Photobacterium atrarenae]